MDGCTYDETTYVLRREGPLAAAGFTETVLRVSGQAYVIVVEAGTAAGRPARRLRALPLASSQPPLLDVEVLIPWMVGPNC
jgi:hypothetical protein